jgi:uncharacterized membrane protein YvbJ
MSTENDEDSNSNSFLVIIIIVIPSIIGLLILILIIYCCKTSKSNDQEDTKNSENKNNNNKKQFYVDPKIENSQRNSQGNYQGQFMNNRDSPDSKSNLYSQNEASAIHLTFENSNFKSTPNTREFKLRKLQKSSLYYKNSNINVNQSGNSNAFCSRENFINSR